MARDLGIPSGLLDSFIEGRASLPPAVLAALATDLFHGHAVFDPELNLLRSANRQEPRAIGPGPPPIWELMELPKYEGGPAPRSYRPVKPEPPVAKPRRPGWVEE